MMSTLPDISHNIANDTSDLFQSDSSLHSQALRNKKAALKVQPGHPIYVTSKAIDMHVAKDGKYIWVAESGWVARKWCTAVKSRGGMNKDNETEGCFDAWMIYSTIRSPVLFIEGFSNGLCRGEASTRKSQKTLRGHTGPVTSIIIQYGNDGKEQYAYTGSWDKTVKKWDIETLECLETLKGHTDFIKSISLHPVTKEIFSSSADTTVRGGGRVFKFPHKRPVEFICFNEDGSLLFAAGSTGLIMIWDSKTGVEHSRLEGHDTGVTQLIYTDNCLWSVSTDRSVRRWDLETKKIDVNLVHPEWPHCMTLVGPWAITAGRDEIIRVWDISNETVVRTFEGHYGSISALAYVGDILFSSSYDETIRRWSLSDKKIADAQTEKKEEPEMTEEEERELAEMMK